MCGCVLFYFFNKLFIYLFIETIKVKSKVFGIYDMLCAHHSQIRSCPIVFLCIYSLLTGAKRKIYI